MQGFDIANGTEQTDNSVKAASQVKVGHVSMMEDDFWIALASDCQHLLVQVKPFEGVVLPQKGKMPPRAASEIEQRGSRRLLILLNHGMDLLGFNGIILHSAINPTIKAFRLLKHAISSFDHSTVITLPL